MTRPSIKSGSDNDGHVTAESRDDAPTPDAQIARGSPQKPGKTTPRGGRPLGSPSLTPQRRRAVEMHAQGYSRREICTEVKCSERTLERWMKRPWWAAASAIAGERARAIRIDRGGELSTKAATLINGRLDADPDSFSTGDLVALHKLGKTPDVPDADRATVLQAVADVPALAAKSRGRIAAERAELFAEREALEALRVEVAAATQAGMCVLCRAELAAADAPAHAADQARGAALLAAELAPRPTVTPEQRRAVVEQERQARPWRFRRRGFEGV